MRDTRAQCRCKEAVELSIRELETLVAIMSCETALDRYAHSSELHEMLFSKNLPFCNLIREGWIKRIRGADPQYVARQKAWRRLGVAQPARTRAA